jgi:hypothetical protein
MKYLYTATTYTFLLLTLFPASAEEKAEGPIKPAAEQTVTIRGEVTEANGVRSITGTRDSFEEHNNHGPITYDNVPFNNGAFSCSWKLEGQNYFLLVFDGKGNGKATVVIDGRTFTVSSDKLRQPIEKFGVAHTWGTLHTKDVKIDKTK